MLELEVRVININEGRNKTIVSHCKPLAEYTMFMAKIRLLNEELGNQEEAIKEAIKYCERHDILREYLEIHGSEVLNMILEEWNTVDAIAYAREEGREDGLIKGRKEGFEKILGIAHDLLKEGIQPELVRKTTGLSEEELEKIMPIL